MQEITFQQLWDKNKQKLKHFIRTNVREKAETDDILQETYLQGFSQFSTLRESEKFSAWIFTISRNYIRHYFQNKKKFANHSEEEWEMMSIQPNLMNEDRNLADLANQCLAKMGDYADVSTENISEIHQRMIAQFADFQQVSIAYIEAWVECDVKKTPQQLFADQKGISLSAAKSRVQRAREKIKKVLMDCCFFEFDVRGSVVNYTPLKKDSKCLADFQQ
jgi:RNA polymerase sigma-70 factor, ECF subfamily